jgi:putative photosynthetic complex assembly protein 2
MNTLWLAVPFVVFSWWFATGLVLLLDQLPRGTFRGSLVVATVTAVAALFAIRHTAGQATVAGAYSAFVCTLLVWAWHELAFLTGWITGPRKLATPAGTRGWPRFVHAVAAILWHELALIATFALIAWLTWGAANDVALMTFAVLWVMRVSAKLNLFLGVRNLSEEFLPPQIAYMASFFRRRRMNPLLPVSVAGALAVLAALIGAAFEPGTHPPEAAGHLLVATLLALAVVEHAMLVLPVSTTWLWRWAMRARAA